MQTNSDFWRRIGGLLLIGFMAVLSAPAGPPKELIVRPKAYAEPLRNPLMGFIGPLNGRHEYATLAREYVKWNSIETAAGDNEEKLRAYAETHWRGAEDRNIKIIPRVVLEWPKGSGAEQYWPIDSYWPADLPRDFGSAQFKERVEIVDLLAAA